VDNGWWRVASSEQNGISKRPLAVEAVVQAGRKRGARNVGSEELFLSENKGEEVAKELKDRIDSGGER
jgi:hypothetical protein